MLTTINLATVFLTILNPTLSAPSSSLSPRTPANGGACRYRTSFIWPDPPTFYSDVDVTLYNTGQEDAGTCQGGFLDNLRGQCGQIDNWGCDSDGTNSWVSFATQGSLPRCVQNAIYLSQDSLSGVMCYEV